MQSNPLNSHLLLTGVLDLPTLKTIRQNPHGDLAKSALLCSAIEIRYDLFCETEEDWKRVGDWAQMVRDLFPQAFVIGTIRLKRDGGKFPTEKSVDRISLFKQILLSNVRPDIVDIEAEELLNIYSKIADDLRKSQTMFLVSHHDFQKVPSAAELEPLISAAKNAGADGFKTACMSTKQGDFDALYPFIKQKSGEFRYFSLFAMGKTGEESRLKSLKFGSNITYCALGNATAPGQIPVAEAMRKLKIESF